MKRHVAIMVALLTFAGSVANGGRMNYKAWWYLCGPTVGTGYPEFASFQGVDIGIGLRHPYGVGASASLLSLWVGSRGAGLDFLALGAHYVPYIRWTESGALPAVDIYAYYSPLVHVFNNEWPSFPFRAGASTSWRLFENSSGWEWALRPYVQFMYIKPLRAAPAEPAVQVGVELAWVTWSALGWEWEETPPPGRPDIYARAWLEYSKGTSWLPTNGSAVLKVEVTNNGDGPSQGLTYDVNIPEPLWGTVRAQTRVRSGGVKAGKSRVLSIPLAAISDLPTGAYQLAVSVTEDGSRVSRSAKTSLATKHVVPEGPKCADLTIRAALDDRKGNSNGRLDATERATLKIDVVNKGRGPSGKVTLNIELPPELRGCVSVQSQVSTFAVASGETRTLQLPVSATADLPDGTFLISLYGTEEGNAAVPGANLQIATGNAGDMQADNLDYKTDVEQIVSRAAAANPDGVAVVVAGSNYEKVPRVEFASRDAATVKDYLIKTLGYNEKNIIFLENPTKADLEMVFGVKGKPQGQLNAWLRRGQSDVFVYYVGHGAPDLKTKEAYLVPVDAQPSYIDLQGYPLSTFYENLAQIPAKSITVVLDACFSGAYDKGLIVQQASPLVVAAAPEQGKLPDNMTLMTSAGGSEVSSWYADKKHSLFTYWFLKGLQGAADKNGDKTITMGEMKAYLSENVPYWAQRLHNRIQTPTFSGDESRVLARVK